MKPPTTDPEADVKVTAVMSFTAPKKIPGVYDTSQYFKYLARVTVWQVESFKYSFLQISKQQSDMMQLTKNSVHNFSQKGFDYSRKKSE